MKPLNGNKSCVIFAPNDPRIPRILISTESVQKEFFDRPQDFLDYLYVAEILNWPEESLLPKGKLIRHLGESGNVNAEIEGILVSHGIDNKPFTRQEIATLSIPQPKKNRSVVFTIADMVR